ncbi:MAG TPA: GFA family protein [Pseudolabrys sp.]|nr:GFA family protein [Pseudolabrys sp.]
MEKHLGGCHCGAVRYEAEVDLSRTITCNCSICQKRGSILTFTTADKFTLLQGDGAQTVYHFNKHAIDHLFCKTCGILSYAQGRAPDGTPMIAVNVRCLDDLDIGALTPQAVDGRSR